MYSSYTTRRYPLYLQVLVAVAFMTGLFLSQKWFLTIENELDRDPSGLDPQPLTLAAASSGNAPCPESTKIMVQSTGTGDILPSAGPARNKLEETLRQIVKGERKEVLVVISNSGLWWNGAGPLRVWIDCVLAAKIENYILVALDEEIAGAFKRNGWNYHYRPTKPPKIQEGTGDNHAYSAAKFGILKEFIDLGYAPFLSDVDVCTIQNPFNFLYRDSDVEGMTDGYDERTAYGFIDGHDDPSMGWARYAQAFKHFNLNSGLFYLRANVRTAALMQRLADRLERQKYWDQTAFNEEIFALAHGSYTSPQCSVRVLDIYLFQNSKVTFKTWRKWRDGDPKKVKPVLIHINYHPDKLERVRAVADYFHRGMTTALDRFPGGSEKGT